MSTKKMGGPAFPSVGEGFGDPRYSAAGMTLWDYYAAAVLSGVTTDIISPENACIYAANAADAMLAERERRVKS